MFNTNSWTFGKKSEKCRGFTNYALGICEHANYVLGITLRTC